MAEPNGAPPRHALFVGSDPARCDLYSRRRTVSARHARLELGPEATIVIVDLGSTNGTFVNGRRLDPDAPTPVRLGDRISLGRSITFELRDWHVAPLFQPHLPVEPRELTDVPTTPEGERQSTQVLSGVTVPEPARQGPSTAVIDRDDIERVLAAAPGSDAPTPEPADPSVSIGYAASNDVVIPNPVVSGRHARIYRLADGRYLLEDQTSTNGTWVRGRRITRALVRPGDPFTLGSHRVVFDEAMRAQLDLADSIPVADRAVPLAPDRELIVGRAPDCDVVVDAPTVSAVHASFVVLPDRSAYILEDRGSTNGTFLNSRTNRVEGRTRVSPADVVFLGSYRLPLARLPALVGRSDTSTEGDRRVFVVGRDPSLVDVPVDSPVVSSRHARVELLPDGSFEVRDLGSSNGTFLNGVAVRGRVRATVADRLSLGSYEVRLDPQRGVARREYHGDIMLQAERVTVEVPDRTHRGATRRIVDDVSFTAYPTEFVGLMGPSGAGKTTLMMALAGILPPVRGRSLVNGLDVYESYNAFRGNIGYVPQDDIVFPQLTVYESLYYTARLRLPPDTSRAEIDAKIDAVLSDLEILHTRNTLIGDALEKGVSGGERKRVNLAQELITGPALLFLDEPTSGLASQDTINVMRLLRGLADGGKTILLTIHQPSLEAYRLMDNVLYLFRGNLVYYGPAYPDSILHFNGEVAAGPERDALLADPGNAMKPLVEEQRRALAAGSPLTVDDVVRRRRAEFAESGYHREYVVERARETDAVDVPHAGIQKTVRKGMWRQLRVLSARAARIKMRDRVNTAILIAQAPVIATILWMVFAVGAGDYFDQLRQGPAALFLLVASAVWFGCSNAAREIVGEQAVYRRERMVNLMIPAYTLSKVAVLGVVCAIQCAALLGIVYAPLGLQGSFAAMYGVLFLTSLVGLGMGLTLSALVRSQQAAMALVPLMLIPQVILGGVIMPIHDLGLVPRVLAATTATRWGFEGMLHAEYGDDDVAELQRHCGIPACVWSTGATGVSLTYYPGDPEQQTRTELASGVEALRGGQIPLVEPEDDPVCQAFCAAVREGDELTPIDRSFGADADDPVRRRAWTDIAIDGHAPDLVTRPRPTVRTSFGTTVAVLGAWFAFFVALVMALLRYRDVEVD